jgi:hypothetical protein
MTAVNILRSMNSATIKKFGLNYKTWRKIITTGRISVNVKNKKVLEWLDQEKK